MPPRSESPPLETTPELAVVLATKARQTGVVVALNQVRETLTLDRLNVLVRGPYADELATLTVARLCQPPPGNPRYRLPSCADVRVDISREDE